MMVHVQVGGPRASVRKVPRDAGMTGPQTNHDTPRHLEWNVSYA